MSNLHIYINVFYKYRFCLLESGYFLRVSIGAREKICMTFISSETPIKIVRVRRAVVFNLD